MTDIRIPRTLRSISFLAVGMAAVLLAACFGGDSDGPAEGARADTASFAPADPRPNVAQPPPDDSTGAPQVVAQDPIGADSVMDGGTGRASTDTAAAQGEPAPDSAGGVPTEAEVDGVVQALRDSLVRVLSDSLEASRVSAEPGDAVSGVPPPTPLLGQQQATPTVPSDLDRRLDRIVEAQDRLAQRMDALADRGSANGGGPSADAGQVLGQASQQVRSFGLGVVWALLVLIFFNYLIRALVWVLDQLAESSVTRRLFYKKLVPITRILLWVFAAYLIVRVIFQVTADGLVAAAAAVGVAVGFAAQDLLKNLFGGIILVFDQPFQVGDKISAGGTYGEVVSIGLRSTRIVTPDDNLVSLPNAQVVDGQVANANAGELNCQVVTDLYLPGWIDEGRAKKIAFEAATSSKYVYLNKPIVVLVKDEFKETFLTHLKVKAYVLDPRYEFLFQSDVTERARAGFREAGLLDVAHGLRTFMHANPPHPEPAAGPESEESARG